MSNKLRADLVLVAQGLAESRTRAQALILAGNVFLGHRRVSKAGDLIAQDAALTLKGRDHPWVSRGGVKLAHGLDRFGFDVTGAIGLDVGSSTGGFTDVLLTRRAAKVYAIDVGTNQLAWKLRSDPRVAVHEQTNARTLSTEIVPEAVDIIVCDASFIACPRCSRPRSGWHAQGQCWSPWSSRSSRPDGAKWAKAEWFATRWSTARVRRCGGMDRFPGWAVVGIETSPITGPEGNVEFLLGAIKGINDE
jgi:23S rRNA (cytidine1920-2'-O)/16S rRNA (cytidine1409-2'-O)-methyltransferase